MVFSSFFNSNNRRQSAYWSQVKFTVWMKQEIASHAIYNFIWSMEAALTNNVINRWKIIISRVINRIFGSLQVILMHLRSKWRPHVCLLFNWIIGIRWNGKTEIAAARVKRTHKSIDTFLSHIVHNLIIAIAIKIHSLHHMITHLWAERIRPMQRITQNKNEINSTIWQVVGETFCIQISRI